LPPPAAAKTILANGVSGCPASPFNPCMLYTPGYYPLGIIVKQETAVLTPGVYYLGGAVGFQAATQADIYMCTTCAADTTTGGTGNDGVLMYIDSLGGGFNISSQANVTLKGSSSSSDYKGILLYQDRATILGTVSTLGGGGA